ELDRENQIIRVKYLDGPFSFLENRWAFNASGETSCEIDFKISYEFRSKMLGTLMGAVFDRAFRKFAAAFETRADKIYGKPSVANNASPDSGKG
ncbi:MAG: SRPBCC family protein, partial [Alphaproteobacteria bacterium]